MTHHDYAGVYFYSICDEAFAPIYFFWRKSFSVGGGGGFAGRRVKCCNQPLRRHASEGGSLRICARLMERACKSLRAAPTFQFF